MPAFAISVAPILYAIESVLHGIQLANGKLHKTKAFADDSKVFLSRPEEIHMVFKLIKKFEIISGLKMHRDPTRQKCQALTFGTHRLYNQWPPWVTLTSVVKVLGVLYSNDPQQTLEQVNSEMVKESALHQLYGAYGMRGTVMQKIYYVNTFILSKIWYVAQTIMLEVKMLKELDKKMRNFIHAGENERPVQALVYRPKDLGGLGLICPVTKSKAFLLKNMYKEWTEISANNDNDEEIYTLYGDFSDLHTVLEEETDCTSIKEIYLSLLKQKIRKGGSLIPSRAEKKNPGIKYKTVWENVNLIKRVDPYLKYFAWGLGQDMIVVGARLHRANQRKQCQQEVEDEETGELSVCGAIETLQHALAFCQSSRIKFEYLKSLAERFLEKSVTEEQLIFLAINHRNKKKLKTMLWVVLKSLYLIWSQRSFSLEDFRKHMGKDMFFHQQLERWAGDRQLFNNILINFRDDV